MTRALLALGVLAACQAGEREIARVPAPVPSGRPALLGNKPLSDRIASYRLEARLDAGARRIAATGRLTWRHTGVAPVTEVPLHLYLNAFKNEQSLFFRESGGQLRTTKMDTEGGQWGWIDLTSIRLDGAELRPAARFGADETLLTVPLPRPVAPGETVALDLTFTSQLPRAFARTGFEGEFMLVGQWFPKIGVLTTTGSEQRWHAEPFHATSEFFADFGTYDVVLDVPDTHVVVATGVLVAVEEKTPGRRRLTYRAEDVHDFVWMADPWMKTLSGKAGEVDVHVVYRPEQEAFARRHLAAAIRTVETFSRLFVPYPWTSITVIDPAPGAVGATGGMEYPTVVTTAGDSPIGGLKVAELVTVHEVGHNWFQGMLASNEVDEPWLDEGLNEYADAIVMDAMFGEDKGVWDRGGMRLGYAGTHHLTDPSLLIHPVRARSYQVRPDDVGAIFYSKTFQVMRTLEGLVGRDALHRAMGVYARRFAFKHPTGEDFLAVMNEELGDAAVRFLRPALAGTEVPDYKLIEMESFRVRPPLGVFGSGAARKTVAEAPPDPARWVHEIQVANVGGLAVPVEVELVFADGKVEIQRWDGEGWRRLTSSHPAKLVSVRIDPRRLVRIEPERVLNGKSEQAPKTPALRAAARATFWEQTLLQLVGL